jgi:PKD repeat protein
MMALVIAVMFLLVPAQGLVGAFEGAFQGGPSIDLWDTPMRDGSSSRSQNCNPPASGDWVVTVETVCASEDLVVNGNVTVQSKLELIDTTLSFDNDATAGYNLSAEPGSELYINGSTINSTTNDTFFAILVDVNVQFSMNDSVVDGAGWKDLERLSGAASGAARTQYNNYFWLLAPGTTDLSFTGDDGVEIRSTPLTFDNNTFRNYTHIRFFSDNNVVEDNTFENMKHEAVAFMTGTQGHVIRNNTFFNATRINREIHGIRFYTGCSHVEIYNNSFEWLPFGISISNIPPWTYGNYFDIHHNTYYKIVVAFNGNFRNSRLHHETIDHVMKGISLEATTNLLVDHNRITNVTFQQDLENVIDKTYYDEVQARGLLLNMAYWMWGFYCSKFMVNLGWWGNNITISDNYFANGPPYTMALNSDQAQGMNRIYIINNTFENIGTYIPDGYIIRKDTTGYNVLMNHTPLDGGSIMLEGSDNVYIEGNIFMNVLNGVTTSAPDALGNFGNFTVDNNLFRGVGRMIWTEQRWDGNWWSGAHQVTRHGVGVATGMHYIPSVGFDWSSWIGETYRADTTQVISNNTFYNMGFPTVVDYLRDQPSANEMGVKIAVLIDNIVLRYIDTMSRATLPNLVAEADNVKEKVYPLPFPNNMAHDAHLTEVSGRYYLVPGGMVFPDHEADDLSWWKDLTWSAVAQSGDLEVVYSTDSGQSWTALPANGSLADAAIDTKTIRFGINLTAGFRLTRALEYDLNLTYVFDNPPVLSPMADQVAEKNTAMTLQAVASDPDGDELSYNWSQVTGTPVTIVNGTTPNATFMTNLSGAYRFLVEVGDGYASVNGSVNVTVGNRHPEVRLEGPTLGFKGETIQLNGSGHDEDGDDIVFVWDQVAGPVVDLLVDTQGNVTTASFSTDTVQTYRFRLTAADNELASNETVIEVIIESRAPVADLTFTPEEVFEGTVVNLSAAGSYDPDGNITSYFFDFGDGTDSGWVAEPLVSHVYNENGTYNVSLKVLDDDMCSANTSLVINVSRRLVPPMADFEVTPENGTVDTTFRFTSNSMDPDGEILSLLWDLGDGSNATGVVVNHTYLAPGTYNVSLTVTDQDGLEAALSKDVIVLPRPNTPPQIDDFTPLTDMTILKGESLSFSVNASDVDGDVLEYYWTVDGLVVSEGARGFVFTPEEVGIYKVRVNVSDGKGDAAHKEWTVTVKKKAGPSPQKDRTMLYAAIGAAVAIAVVLLVVVLLLRRKGEPGMEEGASPEQTAQPTPPQPPQEQPGTTGPGTGEQQ